MAQSLAISAYAESVANDLIEEVIVRAHPLSAEGMTQPVEILAGEALERARAPSIGETLRDLPGVHSSSFGQAVGRPVIRGLGGPRVKTMEDRIDSMDVAVSSPDHATTIESYAAESIEVLKGPSTLLYGTGAIGGVVDVHTGRVPHRVPEQVELRAEVLGADNADQRTASGRLSAGAGKFAFHADGSYRDADEYDIPGEVESAALRALEAAEADLDDRDHLDEESAAGILPGSELETRAGAVGVSYVAESAFVGLSVSTYDAEYGLPGGHGHEHEGEEEGDGEEGEEGTPSLDLDQTRIDIEAGWQAPMAGIESLNLRFGRNDYEHTETEGNGEAGTVFSNEAFEGRLELTHEAWRGIRGAVGVQFSDREFSAIGEEAFVEPVDTRTSGVFYVGRRDSGHSSLEAGVRYEKVEHDPSSGRARNFDVGAISLGLSRAIAQPWMVSAQFDYSSRAPVAEELYSNGPHLATQSFEIGDDTLDSERAANVSATIAYDSDPLRVTLSGYYTDFSDFIFEVATGQTMDELPVLQWRQGDATFTGAEADLSWRAVSWHTGSVTLNAGLDLVRARLSDGNQRNVPRTPPRRWRLGVATQWRNAAVEVTWQTIAAQRDVALAELPTDGYNDLRVHLSYDFNLGEQSELQLFFSGRNLTDDEQRYHTSFIKDFAPQPGRTLEAGVRLRL